MRIWLIDDDDIYKFATSRSIKSEFSDSSVDTFNDGEEALQHFATLKEGPLESIPDIVLLDINMPIMNGWEFLEKYSEHVGGLVKLPRIYMVTSSVNDWDLERASDNELLTGYVSKPLSRETIRKLYADQI